MGGVFNTVNASLYHYAGNNLVKYTDPNGKALPAVPAVWAGLFVAATFEAYLLTPAGQWGVQTLANAISYGVESATKTLTNAVATVKTYVQEKQESKLYMTYTMTNDEGVVYSGRTSGYGTPSEVLEKRHKNHHMTGQGFSSVTIDKFAYGNAGKFAIRGKEQQLIDKHGGAQSDGGYSGNAIRDVSKINPNRFVYHEASNKAFGNIVPYTGYKIIQGD